MESIQTVIQHMRARSPHRQKLTAAGLACAWRTIMPESVRQRTTKTFFREGKFFIQLSSSPLRQSLQLNKSQVVEQLQAHLYAEEPIDVIFL